MTTLSWKHPNHGRIEEHLCDHHLEIVRMGLLVLGIGCIGMDSLGTPSCYRCGTVMPARMWIKQFAVSS